MADIRNKAYTKLLDLASTKAAEYMDANMGALHVGAAVLDAVLEEIETANEAVRWVEEHPVDVHFSADTDADVIYRHLYEKHSNLAPWGAAFSDERPGEMPPRIYGVHAWCHREDGTVDH